jgi:hypothetical protein
MPRVRSKLRPHLMAGLGGKRSLGVPASLCATQPILCGLCSQLAGPLRMRAATCSSQSLHATTRPLAAASFHGRTARPTRPSDHRSWKHCLLPRSSRESRRVGKTARRNLVHSKSSGRRSTRHRDGRRLPRCRRGAGSDRSIYELSTVRAVR